MKPAAIDCANRDWKAFLKNTLQDGQEADLMNFDYTVDGHFCEMLAMAHGLIFKLDVSHNAGSFRKRASAAP
jgi:hypothetical protein